MKDNQKIGILIIVVMHNYRLSIGDDSRCVFPIYQEAQGAEQTRQPSPNNSFYPFPPDMLLVTHTEGGFF